MNTRENTYLMLRKKKVAHTWVNRRKQSSDNSLPPFIIQQGPKGIFPNVSTRWCSITLTINYCMYADMSSSIVCYCIFLTCIHLRFLFFLQGKAPFFCQWIKDGVPHLRKPRRPCFSRQKIKVLLKNVNVCGRNLLVCKRTEKNVVKI